MDMAQTIVDGYFLKQFFVSYDEATYQLLMMREKLE